MIYEIQIMAQLGDRKGHSSNDKGYSMASHVYVDEQWDATIDTSLRNVVYGTLLGGVLGLMMCSACPIFSSSSCCWW